MLLSGTETQVDCLSFHWIGHSRVEDIDARPTWGRVKALYR